MILVSVEKSSKSEFRALWDIKTQNTDSFYQNSLLLALMIHRIDVMVVEEISGDNTGFKKIIVKHYWTELLKRDQLNVQRKRKCKLSDCFYVTVVKESLTYLIFN